MEMRFAKGVIPAPWLVLLIMFVSLGVVNAQQADGADQQDNSLTELSPPSEKRTGVDETINLDELQSVVVKEPFVNIHTGPGVGYPVFHVVEAKETLWIIKRQYNWFYVATKKRKVGWVPLDIMLLTINHDGTPVKFATYNQRDFSERDFEVGVKVGDFGGANLIAVTGSWQFTPNLATEFVVGQGLGDFSEVRQTTIAVINSPWPEWKYSPYLGVGTGIVKVFPSAALVQEVDRKDETVFATAGLKTYISDRFVARVEYRSYAILTSQTTNEEIEEWTIGFNVFF